MNELLVVGFILCMMLFASGFIAGYLWRRFDARNEKAEWLRDFKADIKKLTDPDRR